MRSAKIVSLITVALIIFLMVLLRVAVGSYKEYRQGRQYLLKKENTMAALHFNRAIRFYTPMNPYIKRSLKELFGIGRNYEDLGQRQKAVVLYEKMRSSIMSTRSFYLPYSHEVGVLEGKIASLRSEIEEGVTEQQVINDLSIDRSPSVFYSIIAILGFMGWVGCVLCFLVFGFGKDQIRTKRSLLIGVLFFTFYVVWLLGLAKA